MQMLLLKTGANLQYTNRQTQLSLSFNMKSAGSAEQQQQMKFMTGFMIVFISIASFSLPTAIALYWIVTNGFSVIQNYIVSKRRS